MVLEVVRYLAQTYSASLTASSRPALTFFGVQVGVYALAANQMVVVPEAMTWLHSPVAFGLAGVFAILEVLAHHQDDVSELLQESGVDKVLAVFGAFSAAMLFGSLGLPVEEAVELLGQQSDAQGDVTEAVYVASTSGFPAWVQAFAVSTGLALNIGLTTVRGRIIRALDDFGLKGVWQRVETGGIVGVLTLTPFIPLLVFVALLAVVLVFAGFGLVLLGADKVLDRTGRYRCPDCETLVRQEASICQCCHSELEPKAMLGGRLPTGVPARVQNMIEAVRESRRDPVPAVGAGFT